jgi:hypothetical protein
LQRAESVSPHLFAGYILEGAELAFYIKKMAKKKSGKSKD